MVCCKFAVAILWPLIAPLEDASIVYIGSNCDVATTECHVRLTADTGSGCAFYRFVA
jgi:hypothetical protein